MIASGKKFNVSVIIPLYNRKKLVKRAIKSVLDQSYRNFEIIVVDDGSTDDPYKVIAPIMRSNPNIRYVRHSNRGPALSINAGIKLSEGEFVTFLDSDDEYKKDHLKKRIQYFKKHPKTDLTYSTADVIGKESDMYVPDARNKKKLIHLDDCIIGGTFFGKRKVFDELGGFKNIYAYDYDFFNRAKKKFKIVKLEIPTYIYYRNTPDSILTTLKSK
ncbi:MAG: glycosyltransferase family 2 protein [Ignavibacteriae bacterium]|nr:glycosyltransferase family 2 protein [Ignavibacteriota bacterium]